MNEGKLEKIKIRAFQNQTLTGSESASFEIPINPENYTRNLKVVSCNEQSSGTEGNSPKFKLIEPEELKLDFILDNTGTVEGNTLDGTEVSKQIDTLLEVVYGMEPETHQPNFLKITWQDFNFDCRLKDLSINYVLFKPSGAPLRAKISAAFTAFIDDKKRVKEENKKSPDLTRLRVFKEGDTLPWMLHNIYGDDRLYLKVAKINNLTSFRNIKPGQELEFPPFEK